MARHLLNRQKIVIDKFINSQINDEMGRVMQDSIFKGGKHGLDIEDLPAEVWEQLVRINDTEILHQTVGHYMSERCSDIVHKA